MSPKEVDLWLHESVPLGAKVVRNQLIENFNEKIQNLLADAAAFYFLYGPQKFMKSIEYHILLEDDPMKMGKKDESDFMNEIIWQLKKELSTISQKNIYKFKESFLENLKNIVLKKQTSLTQFRMKHYSNPNDTFYSNERLSTEQFNCKYVI